MFCELLSIKEPQTTLQNKGTTMQSYRKMSIQNTKKSLGILLVLFYETAKEKLWRTYAYSRNSPSPQYEPVRF